MYYLISKFYFFIIYNLKINLDLNLILRIYKQFIIFLPFGAFYLKAARLSILLRKYENSIFFYSKIKKNNLHYVHDEKKIFTEIILFSLEKYYKKKLIKNKCEDISIEFINLITEMRENKSFFNKNIFKNKKVLKLEKRKNFRKLLNKLISNYIGLDVFCEDLLNIFFLSQKLEIDQKKNKKLNVILDKQWFTAFGDIMFLDILIKGIKLNILPIHKIYISAKEFPNNYLFKKYKNILNKENLLISKINKNCINLSLFCWFDKNYNLQLSEWLVHIIIRAWENKYNKSLIIQNHNEKSKFKKLCKKLNIDNNKKIILINIRQSQKSSSLSFPDFRDYDPKILFSTIEKFSNYNFVIIGDDLDYKFYSKNIIKYSNSHLKSKTNDILFLLFADACIGSFSGPSHLFALYGKPTLYLNCSQFWNFPVTKESFYVTSIFKRNENIINQKNFLKIKPPIIWSNEYSLKNLNVTRQFVKEKELTSFIYNFLKYTQNRKYKLKYSICRLRYCWWDRNVPIIKKKLMNNYFHAKVLQK